MGTKTELPLRDWAHLLFAVVIVLLLPYALFGKDKKTAGWIAMVNGIQISMACIFMQPYFLIANPFLALYAISPIWKKKTNAASKY